MASLLRRGFLPLVNASQAVASSSRLISTRKVLDTNTTAAQSSVSSIKSPSEFLGALAKPRRGDLNSIATLLGEDASWKSLHELDRDQLKKAGVPVKQRRYFFWAREKFRQGEDPVTFAIDIKPKKVIRGWGPRVQKGVRVRGRRRPGEK